MVTERHEPDWRALYDEAFARYGTRALWSYRKLDAPTAAEAFAIGRALRANGDMAARQLADRLESACRATH